MKLIQVNPMHTKRLKELMGNSPNKTDKKDPRVIADVISLGYALALVVPEGPVAELRKLTHATELAIISHTALVNQLQHLMFLVFPEFLGIMKKVSAKNAIYLIKNHTTPESVVTMGHQSLTKVRKKISRGPAFPVHIVFSMCKADLMRCYSACAVLWEWPFH